MTRKRCEIQLDVDEKYKWGANGCMGLMGVLSKGTIPTPLTNPNPKNGVQKTTPFELQPNGCS